ncbi:MAG: alcohol dehydrogenase [Nitrospinaceae bacterium]|nr:MAG: alcohol dehydrogenase [Nitrospinaceae bacterium]
MPKIAQLTAPRTIAIKERKPLTANDHEVVIGVETAGVCGTDLALFSGDYPVPLPLVCGHEFVGIVKSIGDGGDKRWLGRRVTAEINNTCVTYNRSSLCRACEMGMPGHCQKRTVTGIIAHDGAFAEEVAVAAGTLHEIPENLDPVLAALTEPLAAALQTFEMTPVTGKETVVVCGPGRLGILIIFVAALKGCRVIAVSRSQAKRQRALQFGASQACSPEEAESVIKALTDGLGADIAVDATGHPDGITQALSLVRPRGIVSVKTTCGLPARGLDMTKLVVDEIRLQGSRCGPFGPALKILSKHQDQLKTLITSIRPLEQAQKALETAASENKVMLKMSL